MRAGSNKTSAFPFIFLFFKIYLFFLFYRSVDVLLLLLLPLSTFGICEARDERRQWLVVNGFRDVPDPFLVRTYIYIYIYNILI